VKLNQDKYNHQLLQVPSLNCPVHTTNNNKITKITRNKRYNKSVCSIVRTASLLHFLCLREGLHLRSVPELAPVDAAEPTLAKLVVVVEIVGRRL
jgi:hypothetical protein